jgi:hypothetical protein
MRQGWVPHDPLLNTSYTPTCEASAAASSSEALPDAHSRTSPQRHANHENPSVLVTLDL